MAGCLLRLLLSLTVVLVLLPHAYAFGAGDIPDYAYLNDKAFRHGDIENILMELNKSIVASASGGAMGLFLGVTNAFGGGPKFSKMDVKRVYFGNWLRDFSQAMDIAGLSRITADTIVMVVMALGFLTFGFATEEFEVTPDRLGVYLPVEHIDNPKGYGEKEGDARRFHPSLRPPVNPRELEIDEQTGMKKYIANETGPWDTSTAHVRRTIESCITYGRRAAGRNGPDMWEAYRLLGTALHTLEDLTAHSNWCELAMRKMGYNRIFCHVGDAVLVKTPLGPAPPLVTGTFGSTDFLHSLLGEATDQLRQASLRDLTKQIDNAKAQNGTSKAILRKLHAILEKLPSSDNRNEMLQQAEEEQYKIFHFDPDDIAPETVQKTLWRLLEWRDKVVKDVVGVIEKIPGLESLLEEVTNTLNAFVLFVLEPWLTPILEDVTQTLQKSSEAIINTEGQYEVFDDPYASDPTHSLLSKDHFSLILNEPAGRIAMIVVRHTVERVVRAWYDPAVDVNQVSREILDAFHHPYFARPDCVLQSEMFEYMQAWIEGMDEVDRNRTLASLDKESVRAGRNHRAPKEEMDSDIVSISSSSGVSASGGAQILEAKRRSVQWTPVVTTFGDGVHRSQRLASEGSFRSYDDSENSDERSEASEERDRGTGQRNTAAGLGLVALGGMLVKEVVDAFDARTDDTRSVRTGSVGAPDDASDAASVSRDSASMVTGTGDGSDDESDGNQTTPRSGGRSVSFASSHGGDAVPSRDIEEEESIHFSPIREVHPRSRSAPTTPIHPITPGSGSGSGGGGRISFARFEEPRSSGRVSWVSQHEPPIPEEPEEPRRSRGFEPPNAGADLRRSRRVEPRNMDDSSRRNRDSLRGRDRDRDRDGGSRGGVGFGTMIMGALLGIMAGRVVGRMFGGGDDETTPNSSPRQQDYSDSGSGSESDGDETPRQGSTSRRVKKASDELEVEVIGAVGLIVLMLTVVYELWMRSK